MSKEPRRGKEAKEARAVEEKKKSLPKTRKRKASALLNKADDDDSNNEEEGHATAEDLPERILHALRDRMQQAVGDKAMAFIKIVVAAAQGDDQEELEQSLINRIAVAIARGNAIILNRGRTYARRAAGRPV